MKIVIIGGGKTGLSLANLLEPSHEVTIIEKDEAIAKALAENTTALVIHGDGTDVSIIKEADISKVDAVVAATGDDNTNLMVCQIAKSENVRKIIPLVHSPKNEELFTKLGITSLVSITGTNVTGIKRLLYSYGDERVIAQLGEGDVQIIEQVISKKSKLVGKPAALEKAVVATIYRKGELIIPTKKTTLEIGDVLLVAVKTKNLPFIADLIKGE